MGAFAAPAMAAPSSAEQIAAQVDAEWAAARGTEALTKLYTPTAVVIRASADGFEPAKSFIAAELGTLQTKPDISLRPVSADRDGKVIHSSTDARAPTWPLAISRSRPPTKTHRPWCP